eukprot:9619059-Lingulodinium_polyedra.AAC.1
MMLRGCVGQPRPGGLWRGAPAAGPDVCPRLRPSRRAPELPQGVDHGRGREDPVSAHEITIAMDEDSLRSGRA